MLPKGETRRQLSGVSYTEKQKMNHSGRDCRKNQQDVTILEEKSKVDIQACG